MITDAKARLCFYQHWSVFLSVTNIIQKVMNGFYEIFRIAQQ